MVISLSVFVIFSWAYLGEKITWNVMLGFGLICLGAFLIFTKFGDSAQSEEAVPYNQPVVISAETRE
jgi:drug/metabolite transporter (DMT)-like permease